MNGKKSAKAVIKDSSATRRATRVDGTPREGTPPTIIPASVALLSNDLVA